MSIDKEKVEEFFAETTERLKTQAKRIGDVMDQHLGIIENLPKGEPIQYEVGSFLHNLAWAQCQTLECINEAIGRPGRFGKSR